MNALEAVRVALRALLANKLRGVLTMLGVIIGVAAVITLMSIGRGAQQQITEQVQSLGTNLIFISPGAQRQQSDEMLGHRLEEMWPGDLIVLFRDIVVSRPTAIVLAATVRQRSADRTRPV